ncbi:MAG: PAS domain-containing protein [Calditrichaeota bacterium]|nr:PAS domain-containing protein [Calditrichota bacterium]
MSKHFEKRKQAISAVNKFYSTISAGKSGDSKPDEELVIKYDLLLKRFNELEKIYHFHKAILQNLSSGILIINHEGKIVFANRSALTLLGYNFLQLQGRPVSVLFADQDEGRHFLTLLKEETQLKSKEAIFLTKEKTTVPVGLTTSPFKNLDTHQTEGFIIHFRDIKAQIEQRRQLERMERLATLGELAAGIAHEIRNPLASIKAASQVLEESFKPDDFRSQLVTRIINAIDRSNDLLSRFFDFTKPRKPVQEYHNIEMLIDGIYLLLAPRLKKKKIRFVKRFENRLPQVFVDPSQIEQVFMNLFLNAIDAMPDGGDLMVSTSLIKDAVLDDGEQAADAIWVKVADTGIGIPEENLEKIFNPFFTTKSSGIGLGLSITNRLMIENGGKIEVFSKKDKGTEFILYFPVPNTV